MKRDGIVIHCSDTPPEMDIGVAEIRQWHTDPPRSWSDLGYHYVIRRDGSVESGRPLDRDGAHAKGFNHYIGVCVVGGMAGDGRQPCNFTAGQWRALAILVERLTRDHDIGDDRIVGHNEVSDKACPGFDVRAWRAAA